MRFNKYQTRRFSLIEIMIVVVIIGLLMALVGPSALKKLKRAKHDTAKMQIRLLGDAVKDYYIDVGNYPSSLNGLLQGSDDKWNGPYLDPPKLPEDPWGAEYIYRQPGEHGDFDIVSYGADGSPGGDGENADVVSWE